MIISSERELQDELVIHLKEQGFNVKQYVPCAVGIADVVIDNAVIEIKHLPDREALFKAVGQAVLYRGAINKDSDAKVICSVLNPSSLELAITSLSQSGIELIPWIPGDILAFETDKVWRVKNTHQASDICWLSSLCESNLLKYNKCWAIVTQTYEYECSVRLFGKEIIVPSQHLRRLDLEEKYQIELRSVIDRISKLQRCDLDAADDGFLDLLQRRTCFTPRQLLLLRRMEEDYGIE